MKSYLFHIIRPINLAIVAVSQLAIYFLFIIPTFEEHDIESVLKGNLIFLFVAVTVLIAAGGYVINDIKDEKADEVNKPDKTFIGQAKLPIELAKQYYYVLVIIGGLTAAYIANEISKPVLFIIYPVAVLLLYLYSHLFKKRPLSGNIIVAIFCAFVPAIIWYAESDGMSSLMLHNRALIILFAGYILFGLFMTLAREIVKDIEDIEGDKINGYRTFPIVAGIQKAKFLALFNMLNLISSFALWVWALHKLDSWIGFIALALLLLFPTIITFYKLYHAETKQEFAQISRDMKYSMLSSLVVFIIILKIV